MRNTSKLTIKAKVSGKGVVIPLKLLEGVEEVEIRKENGLFVVIPTIKNDPILEMGKHPVICGVSDASENHDQDLNTELDKKDYYSAIETKRKSKKWTFHRELKQKIGLEE